MADGDSVKRDLQEYLQEKDINSLFINMVESLLLSKPDDPIPHLIHYLQAKISGENLEHPAIRRGSERSVASDTIHKDSLRDTDVSDMSDSEEDEEEDDLVEDTFMVQFKKPIGHNRRVSVSAEALNLSDAKKFEHVVHAKSDEERKRIGGIVAGNLLFKSLDDKQHQIVLDAMFRKDFEPGDVIIKQGDDGDNFYILESGVCEVYKNGHLVQTCTQAMSFGELALMYNAPRAATVKATEVSKAWALDRQTFKYIIMETTFLKREAHKGFIDKIPLLESLNEHERLTVTDALKSETFQDGEVIIRQGDGGNHFYIIEEGVAVCTQHIAGLSAEIGTLTTGAYFGEIALLTPRPRQATVTAKGTVKCLSLDRKTFKRVMGPLEDILKRNLDRYNSVIANNI